MTDLISLHQDVIHKLYSKFKKIQYINIELITVQVLEWEELCSSWVGGGRRGYTLLCNISGNPKSVNVSSSNKDVKTILNEYLMIIININDTIFRDADEI